MSSQNINEKRSDWNHDMSQERLDNHERRISQVEAKLNHTVMRADVMQMIEPIQRQVSNLDSDMRHSVAGFTEDLSGFGIKLNTFTESLTKLNEEQMRNAGKHAEEKHLAEMALKDEQIKIAKQQVEDKKLVNQIKDFWLPLCGLTTAGSGTIVVVWKAVTWLLANVPK